MAGERLRKAKQAAVLGFEVGLDDMASALQWKDDWASFQEAVKETNREARSKSSLTSFIRTAVFYGMAAVGAPWLAGKMALTGIGSLAAQAGMSIGGSALAGSIVDKNIGGIPVPKAPIARNSKFNKVRNLEKQTQLETNYDELEADVEQIEDDIDAAHLMEPLTQAIAFYGPQMAKEVGLISSAGGANAASTTGDAGTSAAGAAGTEVGGTEATINTVEPVDAGSGAGEVKSDTGTGTDGAVGADDLGMSSGGSETVIDWDKIDLALEEMWDDVKTTASNVTADITELMDWEINPYVAKDNAYDYLDDIIDGMA
tara:strand:- start:592 stop:1536 length:945 start_codon:yes stop_codon:yes gene_type:complete